jgi:Mn2+/Fe2+ NRAMP family transporter
MSATKTSIRGIWRALGPGLTTGAADDDPSGIATYSQAGAQFGFALTWTMFLTLPFMAAIQIISACIGWQTRKGLAANIALRLLLSVLYVPVLLASLSGGRGIAVESPAAIWSEASAG